MNNPKNKIILSIIIVCFFVSHIFAWGNYPSEVDIICIDFNYNVYNHSDDALTITKNNTTPIHEYEWQSGGAINDEFAYIKAQENRKIQAKFIHNGDPNTMLNMVIGGGVIEGTGFCTWFGYTTVYFDGGDSGMLPLNYSSTATFQCHGTVPNNIGKRSFKFVWDVVAINGENYCLNIGTTGWHNYYTLLNEPQSPMPVPWTDVLDYSCDWASGQTSVSSALAELTEELYNCGATYHGGEHYTRGYNYTHIDLTDLLADLSNPNVDVYMDCRDFSNFLQVLTNSLGGNCQYSRIDKSTNPDYEGFTYNYLFPAGWSSKDYPDYWNYHQVGWYSSKVSDAATKIDNDSDPTSSPHTWKLAKNDMTLSSYIDKLTETSNVSSVATGTCTVE